MEQRTLKNVNNYLNIWIIWRFGMPEKKEETMRIVPKAYPAKIGWYLCEI